MKNAAHPAANETKKVHTVAKGTLSLAAQHNKRSTDKDALQKEAEQMPQAAEQALAAAAQALHDQETGKGEVGVDLASKTPANNVEQMDADIPRIVVREGLRGEKLVFFVDSETPQGTIEMYDTASPKAEKEVVKVLFYKQATGPIKDVKEKDKVVSAVVKAFNFPRIILRERLVKENSKIQQDDNGKANTVDLNDYKEKLIAAITKAIREA